MSKQTAKALRNAILAADDSADVVELEIPEWNKTVHLKPMSGGDLDTYEIAYNDEAQCKNIRAIAASLVLCDKNGEALFTAKDVPALSKKRGTALNRIFQAIHDKGLAGSVVQAEKKSETESKETGSELSSEQET